MCGINGFVDFNHKIEDNHKYKLIKTMNDKIIHRGPDDHGHSIVKNVVLGMRRLSIIDLVTGEQPIYSFDNKQVIVFNGEIYNYKEVKNILISKGYIFNTTSDTEVLLYAYKEFGNNFVNLIKGMFSIAIYDSSLEKLIIVRDRAGEKPLYYYVDDDIFIFSSELKSILSTQLIDKSININALNQYLQLTYIPSPLTIFNGIYKLKPGHILEVDFKRNIKITKYWDIEFDDNNQIKSKKECIQELRENVFNSVEQALNADVPVGIFLSGGIDSTIIAGVAAKISNNQINTFTIGFNDKQFDERSRAQIASSQINSKHRLFVLDYNKILPEINYMISNIDEPFADSSYIPSYMVSKFAKNYVKTVLTGDAGDELFAGYEKYLIGYYSDKYNRLPKVLKKTIEKIIYLFPDRSNFSRKIRKVIENSPLNIYEQRKNMMCLGFKDTELNRLLNIDFLASNHLDFIKETYESQKLTSNEINKALYTDFKIVLEGDMLTKMDRASMLSSLETRVPLLDKDIIELASRIPSKYKLNKSNKKIIFKEAFTDILPKKLLKAQKKGFRVPIGHWFRNELKEDLLFVLDEKKIKEQNIFNYEFIRIILDEHFNMTKNRESELWTLYVFQKWYSNYFE